MHDQQVPAAISDAARARILEKLKLQEADNVHPLMVQAQCLRMLDWLIGRIEFDNSRIVTDTDIRVGHAKLVCNSLTSAYANYPKDDVVLARVTAVMDIAARALDDDQLLSSLIRPAANAH